MPPVNQGKRRHLNQQVKIWSLALRDGGTPIKKICDEFGVSRTSIQALVHWDPSRVPQEAVRQHAQAPADGGGLQWRDDQVLDTQNHCKHV